MIVDSVSSLFRTDYPTSQDSLLRHENQFRGLLTRMSEEFNVAVYITSETSTNWPRTEHDVMREIARSQSTTRLSLRKGSGCTGLTSGSGWGCAGSLFRQRYCKCRDRAPQRYCKVYDSPDDDEYPASIPRFKFTEGVGRLLEYQELESLRPRKQAKRLLAWAKSSLLCSLLDDSFDLEIVGKIGAAVRRAYESSPKDACFQITEAGIADIAD